MPFKCDICGKMRKHTHFIGDMNRSSQDQRYIADLIAFAQMRGESVSQYSIPGGSMDDMRNNLRATFKQEEKDAKEFRRRVSKELDEQKKRGEKQDKKKAAETVKKAKKKGFFSW